MLAYSLSLLTVTLAFFQLAKDWQAHQRPWRRGLVMILLVLVGVGGVLEKALADRQNAARRTDAQRQIAGLENAVATANLSQEMNTKVFLKSFEDLSQKLANLEGQIMTTGLQEEAAGLRAELAATKKALTPAQAILESSLGDVTQDLKNLEIKERRVNRAPDGTVSFTIRVVNKSKARARNGFVSLRMCEACQFAEEPQGSYKVDEERRLDFKTLDAHIGIAARLRIRPPMGSTQFQIGVISRCENCVFRNYENLYVRY